MFSRPVFELEGVEERESTRTERYVASVLVVAANKAPLLAMVRAFERKRPKSAAEPADWVKTLTARPPRWFLTKLPSLSGRESKMSTRYPYTP